MENDGKSNLGRLADGAHEVSHKCRLRLVMGAHLPFSNTNILMGVFSDTIVTIQILADSPLPAGQ
jgi:hypothetical protein